MNKPALAEIAAETQLDAAQGTAMLMDFVSSEWAAYVRSPGRTMRSCMRIPPAVQRIVICGCEYEFSSRKREIWFPRTDDGYNGNRFFITEAVDKRGQMWQLELDRCRGNSCDDLILIRATPLGMSGVLHNHWGTGRRVMRD